MWGSLLALASLAPFANALLRFPCAQLVTERLDPLVTPGEISPHVHQIVGGDAFNLSMPHDNDLSTLATCTTCRFKEDFSNYWTAVLYFKARNGTYIRVPQMANLYVGSPNGGVTAYYIQPIGANNIKVVAPPKGFRMIVGNPMVRSLNYSDPNSPAAKAISFRCFNANMGSDANWPHPGTGPLDTVNLPTKNCAGGIRSNIFFPSCWDGKTLDPPDHASHVTFPVGNLPRDGHFFNVGTCPSSHPVRLPLILYEIVWDTRQFANQWPTDGSQPFVFSMGDPTGYGQHGDYLFGWKGDALQRAMDRCTDIGGQPESCRELTIQNDATINRCTKKTVVNEVVEGQYLQALPGCNPIQNGPNPATMAPCGAVPLPTSTPPVTVVPPPATTSQPVVTTPPPPATTAPAPLQTHWGQCGGQGWTGPTQCQAPYKCQVSNQYYSQCV